MRAGVWSGAVETAAGWGAQLCKGSREGSFPGEQGFELSLQGHVFQAERSK